MIFVGENLCSFCSRQFFEVYEFLSAYLTYIDTVSYLALSVYTVSYLALSVYRIEFLFRVIHLISYFFRHVLSKDAGFIFFTVSFSLYTWV